MTKKLGVYRCEHCGNIVEVLHTGGGALICCGEEMKLLEGKTAESSTEKHVPFIEETSNGYKVKIGENNAHPMVEEHYIEWIELIVDDKSYIEFLKPGAKPEAEFCIAKGNSVKAIEYCSVHGLWKNK